MTPKLKLTRLSPKRLAACLAALALALTACDAPQAAVLDAQTSGSDSSNGGASASTTRSSASPAAPHAVDPVAATTAPGDVRTPAQSEGGAAPATPAAVAPAPISPGCTAAANGQVGAHTLQLPGGRSSELYVPNSYQPKTPTMLVLDFHGFMDDPSDQEQLDNLNRHADTGNFIVARPAGMNFSFNAGACCGDASIKKIDDVAFTRSVVSAIEAAYCVDPSQVFAMGYSNGGMFTHRLGCEMADVFAGIASVSGALLNQSFQCAPSRPVSVLEIHGTADDYVPFSGGIANAYGWLSNIATFGGLAGGLDESGIARALAGIPAGVTPKNVGVDAMVASEAFPYPATPDNVRAWRNFNRCSDTTAITFHQDDVTCESPSSACAANSQVTLCTVEGGGHTWPGTSVTQLGGATTATISATSTIVQFFQAHGRKP